LNLNFLPVKRQQRLHSFLSRRGRIVLQVLFCFPNNWKIDGDYPSAGGQRNSFLGRTSFSPTDERFQLM